MLLVSHCHSSLCATAMVLVCICQNAYSNCLMSFYWSTDVIPSLLLCLMSTTRYNCSKLRFVLKPTCWWPFSFSWFGPFVQSTPPQQRGSVIQGTYAIQHAKSCIESFTFLFRNHQLVGSLIKEVGYILFVIFFPPVFKHFVLVIYIVYLFKRKLPIPSFPDGI